MDIARYSSLIGKRVEVHYRAGELQFSAHGTLTSDDGEAISVEEHFVQEGKKKTLRVDIPYAYVIRIMEIDGEIRPFDAPDKGPSK